MGAGKVIFERATVRIFDNDFDCAHNRVVKRKNHKKMEPHIPPKVNHVSEPINPPTPPTLEVQPKNESKVLIMAEIILLVVMGIIASIWYQKTFSTTPPKVAETYPTQTDSTSPTPIPLKSGAETYTVSQSSRIGPDISTVFMDPLDVLKGQTLTVIAEISDTSNITSVTGSLEMDTSKIDIVFTKESGDLKKGSWVAKIDLTDSVFYVYKLTIKATSANGTNSIKVTPR